MSLSVLAYLAADMSARGLAPATVVAYSRIIRPHLELHPDVETLDRLTVSEWIHTADTKSKQRHRYLAVNAVGRWTNKSALIIAGRKYNHAERNNNCVLALGKLSECTASFASSCIEAVVTGRSRGGAMRRRAQRPVTSVDNQTNIRHSWL